MGKHSKKIANKIERVTVDIDSGKVERTKDKPEGVVVEHILIDGALYVPVVDVLGVLPGEFAKIGATNLLKGAGLERDKDWFVVNSLPMRKGGKTILALHKDVAEMMRYYHIDTLRPKEYKWFMQGAEEAVKVVEPMQNFTVENGELVPIKNCYKPEDEAPVKDVDVEKLYGIIKQLTTAVNAMVDMTIKIGAKQEKMQKDLDEATKLLNTNHFKRYMKKVLTDRKEELA